MGEGIMGSENAKRDLATEQEAFNAEKKGLNWRMLDAEDKLIKEQKLHAELQKEWTSACERSNWDLKAARDEVIRVKGEKDAESREVQHLSSIAKEKEAQAVEAQKSHAEALARVAELQRIVDGQQNQNKALELLSQELGGDCKWLLTRGMPLLADRLVASEEWAKYMFELGGAAYNNGRKNGYAEGKTFVKEDCAANYAAKCHEFGFLEFGMVKAI
ncbi:hypothetical protein HanRHA438_Chr16g0755521 [Helianthus annuus]|uniref:Uncharacterized protein n=1 Tax=Helianthus annuus TaxID=4232 RepID=A0A9K3GY94_HELAN|nr:hypothetical protein HanXRQr2_Chr16g0743521 [Helianthus annuus]KAJ0437807.1 hypothetical protein HanHA300_Chr16g0606431 [Helianthus annuus]KAJ0442366.1 hypothetical protein HanIR_Chr16g0808371 [Helianthus annuus]KAJ0460130.1 hypothetical protein HanHA89_Chr16g0657011 [Helianthus annuus]KAJ0640573.1 hypothetical protein HanLR1_Chr16g0617041 [Helianthus annuus]